MYTREDLTNLNTPSVEKLIRSHLDLYEIMEASDIITTSEHYLDMEELEEETQRVKEELFNLQEDVKKIKLQLAQRASEKNIPWEVKANKALVYKGNLISRLQKYLTEKNSELKKVRQIVNLGQVVTFAREIMTDEQWEAFIEKIRATYQYKNR